MAESQSFTYLFFFRNVFFFFWQMVPLGLIDNKAAALCYVFMRGLQDHGIIPVVSRVFKENNSQTRLFLPAWTV